ncbi:WD40 repeat domain-containing protein [Saccharothrix variisporea]|uniref:WD40 repeat protein n=1 Tax=Saccharothrix variisporea TaxID=543527 RepID=A0A495WZZ4_9PSEU|nr:WD40 repeat domain-containing protein [Saccharothrix variisporea]RKT67441.1 WD40 repeat protein [Saccharothrix variisporea]
MSEEGGDVHQRAEVSGQGRVVQAGRDLYHAERDQHVYLGDGPHGRRRTTGPVVEDCPYPGLAAFDADQARWFFGRDDVVAELLARLDRRLTTGGIQVVVAPSGAGKSSLLRAGLLPALARSALPGSSRWSGVVFTPTAEPLEAWGRHVTGDERIVVVDQFEELFTLCADEAERRAFVAALAESAGKALVVVGVRADFYAACVDHPPLRAALQDAPLVVGALTEAQLREAILHPAHDVGLEVEPGLVELLLRELGATTGSGYEAGRLPLLAHALRACWQQRSGATLTVQGYRDTGGIGRAIAVTAEQVYEALSDDDRRRARSLFLRLVKIGDEDTRRRLTGTDPDARDVVEAFTQARLLTRAQDTVEITHEALLRHWPRLREWIDADRSGRLVHQELEDTAGAWALRGRDPSLLYRGSRLDAALEWAGTAAPGDLDAVAGEFLLASKRARRRDARRRTAVVAVLAVLALVASTVAVVAYQQQGDARRQRDLATYHRVLAEADRLRDVDVSLSAQLTLVAHRMRPDDRTRTRLIGAANATLATPLPTHDVLAMALSPDGRTLVTGGGDHTVRLWDVSDPFYPGPLGAPMTGHTAIVSSVAFSPDGRRIASGAEDRTVRLWDLNGTAHDVLTGHTDDVRAVAFSPDGRTLASGGDDDSIRLWDVSDPARPRSAGVTAAHTDDVRALAFSPDGALLVSGGDDAVRLWRPSDPLTPVGTPLSHGSAVGAVAVSPDGRTLATGSADDTIRLFDLVDPGRPRYVRQLTGHTSGVRDLAFSRDGQTLASGGYDAKARLWSVGRPEAAAALGPPLAGHANTITAVALSPDGRTLFTGGTDSSVRLWHRTGLLTAAHAGTVWSLAFSPDGRTLASAGRDRAVRLWDVSSSARPAPRGAITGDSAAGARPASVAFHPDGRTIAVGGEDHTVRLWDVSGEPTPLGDPLTGHTDIVRAVTFTRDGRLLASVDDQGVVRLWDVATPTSPRLLATQPPRLEGILLSVAFSPDSRLLATGGTNTGVPLWSVADPAHPAPAPTLSGHTNAALSVAFSPDGRTLASVGGDRTVRLWDVSDPARPTALGQPLTGHGDTVWSVAFSPDGRTLVTGGADRSVRLWDVSRPADAKPVGDPLLGHSDFVHRVAFSPDGHTVASAGVDRSVLLWELDVERDVERICAATRTALDTASWQRYVTGEYDPPCRG